MRGEVRVFFLISGDGGAKWSWGEMVVGRNGRPLGRNGRGAKWSTISPHVGVLPFRPKWGEMGRNDWGEMALGRND